MKEILKEIQPTRKEKQEVKNIVKEIKKKIHIPYTKVVLGGSSAKGTWLRNNHDIDLYIVFDPKKYEGILISEVLKEHVQDATILHGSRDYLQIKKGEYTVELIPIMDIKKVEHGKIVPSTKDEFDKVFAENKGKLNTKISGDVFKILEKELGQFEIEL